MRNFELSCCAHNQKETNKMSKYSKNNDHMIATSPPLVFLYHLFLISALWALPQTRNDFSDDLLLLVSHTDVVSHPRIFDYLTLSHVRKYLYPRSPSNKFARISLVDDC